MEKLKSKRTAQNIIQAQKDVWREEKIQDQENYEVEKNGGYFLLSFGSSSVDLESI